MIKERKICIKNMQNTKAGENPILPLLNASDCMQESYAKSKKRYKDQRSFRANF